MLERSHHTNVEMQTTHLFDSATGYLYSVELFEKDLYRGNATEKRATIHSDSFSMGNKHQSGRVHP